MITIESIIATRDVIRSFEAESRAFDIVVRQARQMAESHNSNYQDRMERLFESDDDGDITAACQYQIWIAENVIWCAEYTLLTAHRLLGGLQNVPDYMFSDHGGLVMRVVQAMYPPRR